MDENNINDRESKRLTDLEENAEILPEDTEIASEEMDRLEGMNLDELLEDARQSADMTDAEPASKSPAPEQPAETFKDETYRQIFGEGDELRRMFEENEPSQDSSQPQGIPELEKEPVQNTQEPEKETEEINLRKGRPKRKNGYGMFGIPHILATCAWLLIVVAIGVSMGRMIWVCVSDVLAFGREEKIVEVRIDNDDTLDAITQKLHDAGLIRYPGLFKLYAGFTDAREEIGSGTFTLNTLYDYHALVDSLSNYSSSNEEVTVLIPEGYTCAQIFALMEEEGVCSAEELENYAKDGELDEYWFLEGVKRGDKYCLEGFLFPDTYEFYKNSSARRVLHKMLDNFAYRFNDDMKASIDTLNERLAAKMSANGYGDEYIQEYKMSMRDVVTVASLIEKETAGSEESANISSVIYNRLTNQDQWPYLNIDAALLYAIGHREEISVEDKEADTPYNTYKYPGLVPGPIANPGLNSLKAALNPNDTGYYCYALDPATEAHHFSETLDEHNAFLASLGDE